MQAQARSVSGILLDCRQPLTRMCTAFNHARTAGVANKKVLVIRKPGEVFGGFTDQKLKASFEVGGSSLAGGDVTKNTLGVNARVPGLCLSVPTHPPRQHQPVSMCRGNRGCGRHFIVSSGSRPSYPPCCAARVAPRCFALSVTYTLSTRSTHAPGVPVQRGGPTAGHPIMHGTCFTCRQGGGHAPKLPSSIRI